MKCWEIRVSASWTGFGPSWVVDKATAIIYDDNEDVAKQEAIKMACEESDHFKELKDWKVEWCFERTQHSSIVHFEHDES